MEQEPTKKKFKFKIRVQADRYEVDAKGQPTFIVAVNDWYQNVGKESLEDYFKKMEPVNDFSSYKNFEFGDSVDKEAYD